MCCCWPIETKQKASSATDQSMKHAMDHRRPSYLVVVVAIPCDRSKGFDGDHFVAALLLLDTGPLFVSDINFGTCLQACEGTRVLRVCNVSRVVAGKARAVVGLLVTAADALPVAREANLSIGVHVATVGIPMPLGPVRADSQHALALVAVPATVLSPRAFLWALGLTRWGPGCLSDGYCSSHPGVEQSFSSPHGPHNRGKDSFQF